MALQPGTKIRTRVQNPYGHTRLPRYVAGRPGVIVAAQGEFSLPDVAVFGGTQVETVYTVRFEARDLWGSDAEPNAAVCADLWASYLETDLDTVSGATSDNATEDPSS